jgi:hypothetical protein
VVQGVEVGQESVGSDQEFGESDQAALVESDHWGRAWVRVVVVERSREMRVRPLILADVRG